MSYRTIFALLYGLGLRVGEVARLCVGDIDFNRDLLVIRRTKFAKDRLVPFGPRLAGVLRAYLDGCQQRFGPSTADAPAFSFIAGKGVNANTISMTFRSLVR